MYSVTEIGVSCWERVIFNTPALCTTRASGTWDGVIGGNGDGVSFTLDLDQRFQALAGNIIVGDDGAALIDTAVTGETVTFSVARTAPLPLAGMTFHGRADGDRIEGTADTGSENGGDRRIFHATRRAGTAVRIDE